MNVGDLVKWSWHLNTDWATTHFVGIVIGSKLYKTDYEKIRVLKVLDNTGQAVEVFKQLRHQVESTRQVRDAEVGLTHNVGGSGATCAVHIFGRER